MLCKEKLRFLAAEPSEHGVSRVTLDLRREPQEGEVHKEEGAVSQNTGQAAQHIHSLLTFPLWREEFGF